MSWLSPDMRRGAIARVDPIVGLVPLSIAVFQYNPGEITRSVSRPGGTQGPRFGSVPTETLSMRVELDAADQLERGDRDGIPPSIYPAMSALEMLIYPSVAATLGQLALSKMGAIEVLPSAPQIGILLWGVRALPVRLTQLSAKETAFDSHLNPIRADVDLSLNVLSHEDLGWMNAGSFLYLAHQLRREAFALANTVGAL